MKNSETKILELKARLNMEGVPPEEFIQFVRDVIYAMPECWQDTASRFYLEDKGQKFDQETGRPLQSDSRFHIMNEHARRAFTTILNLARNNPQTLRWLLAKYSEN